MVQKQQIQKLPLTRSRRKPLSKRSPRRTKAKLLQVQAPWEKWTPKRKAVFMRVIKIAFYYILGYVLAIAAFFIVYLLTSKEVDPLIVQITGFIVASITGGIHKAINWQAAGVDPSAIPAPTLDASLPSAIALPTIANKEEG